MALALPSFIRFLNEELEREWEVSCDGTVVHQRDGRPDAEDFGTEKAAVLALRRLVLEHLDDGFGLEGALPRFDQPSGVELGISFNDATARLLPLLTKRAKLFKRLTRLDLLGRISYERLGEFREVAHVLAGIPYVGIGAFDGRRAVLAAPVGGALMVRAPTGATCAAHPDAPAPTVCERCGVFMCRECSARYVEERCAKCRPRYGRAELDERRLNRVAKLPWLRCDVCGLEGPRFDRVEPISLGAVLLVPLLALTSMGVLGLLYLAMVLSANRKPMCPGCERSDGLEPSLKVDLPRPPGWEELSRAQSKTTLRNVAVAVLTLAALVLGVVLLVSLWR